MFTVVEHRIGGWLPRDHRVLERWLAKKIEQCSAKTQDFHPVIQEFKNLIEQDAESYMGFHQMFEQVPTKPPYNNDPAGKSQVGCTRLFSLLSSSSEFIDFCVSFLLSQVRDYMTMLTLFNKILTEAPAFEETAYEVDFVGFPINAILDWPMGTPAGFTTFINPKVNAQFKKMFDVWASFSSPQSRVMSSPLTRPAGLVPVGVPPCPISWKTTYAILLRSITDLNPGMTSSPGSSDLVSVPSYSRITTTS